MPRLSEGLAAGVEVGAAAGVWAKAAVKLATSSMMIAKPGQTTATNGTEFRELIVVVLIASLLRTLYKTLGAVDRG